jgi:hypothetical protein
MAERCELTELIKDQCGHCRPKPPPAPRENTGYGPWFPANFPGWCSGCGGEFGTGDEIRSDGCGEWLAECCGGVDA